MKKLIKVDKKENTKCIDIELTDRCNYRCTYCRPTGWRGGTNLEYDQLVNFLEKVMEDKNQQYNVVLSGGEPTVHPRIIDVLKYLHDRGIHVTLVSNGSRRLEWWKKNLRYIDKLVFSYQINSAILEEFIEKIKFITRHRKIQINLSMIPERFDECLQIAEELKKVQNLTIVLKALKNKKIKPRRLYNYTEEQMNIMSNAVESIETPTIKDRNVPVVSYYFDDGTVEDIPSYKVITKKLNQYKGWTCWKGIDSIRIRCDGDLYLAVCDLTYDITYDNINNDQFSPPEKPCTCEHDYCFCVTDLITLRKEANDE